MLSEASLQMYKSLTDIRGEVGDMIQMCVSSLWLQLYPHTGHNAYIEPQMWLFAFGLVCPQSYLILLLAVRQQRFIC